MKIELNEAEVNALLALLNAGVRSIGLQSVKSAAVLLAKIEDAAQAQPSNVVGMKQDQDDVIAS